MHPASEKQNTVTAFVKACNGCQLPFKQGPKFRPTDFQIAFAQVLKDLWVLISRTQFRRFLGLCVFLGLLFRNWTQSALNLVNIIFRCLRIWELRLSNCCWISRIWAHKPLGPGLKSMNGRPQTAEPALQPLNSRPGFGEAGKNCRIAAPLWRHLPRQL